MGIDVEFQARLHEPMTEEEFAEMRGRFRQRFPAEEPTLPHQRYPDIRLGEFGPDIIDVISLARYYGPGYARGHWPSIREMGDWLAVALGERAELRYGGDNRSDFDSLDSWSQARVECEAFWQKYGNEPYRSAAR